MAEIALAGALACFGNRAWCGGACQICDVESSVWGVRVSSAVNIFSLSERNDLVSLLYSPRIQADDTYGTELY